MEEVKTQAASQIVEIDWSCSHHCLKYDSGFLPRYLFVPTEYIVGGFVSQILSPSLPLLHTPISSH